MNLIQIVGLGFLAISSVAAKADIVCYGQDEDDAEVKVVIQLEKTNTVHFPDINYKRRGVTTIEQNGYTKKYISEYNGLGMHLRMGYLSSISSQLSQGAKISLSKRFFQNYEPIGPLKGALTYGTKATKVDLICE